MIHTHTYERILADPRQVSTLVAFPWPVAVDTWLYFSSGGHWLNAAVAGGFLGAWLWNLRCVVRSPRVVVAITHG